MPIYVHSRELVHELRWQHRLVTRRKRAQRASKKARDPRGSKHDKRFNAEINRAIALDRDEEK